MKKANRTKGEAIAYLLTLRNPNDITTKLWDELGLSFDRFLTFAQLNKAQSEQALIGIQNHYVCRTEQVPKKV